MKYREVGANRAVWVPDVLFVDIDVCHGLGLCPNYLRVSQFCSDVMYPVSPENPPQKGSVA